VIVILFATSFFTSVYTHLTLEKFVLAVLAPLLPMLLWAIKEFRKQSAAVKSLERTQIHAEQAWGLLCEGKLTEEQSLHEARGIQDALYDRRKTNSLIFDWVYRLARNRQDSSMNIASEEFVRQFQQAQGR
jgi:SMODS-associating 4TM effector domain